MKRLFLLSAFSFIYHIITAQCAGPKIDNFFPMSGRTGTAGSTSVTIIGSNFNAIAANNVVYFGGVKGNVTSASPSSDKLIVTAPWGSLNQPISVLDKATNKLGYSQLPFTPSSCLSPLSLSPIAPFKSPGLLNGSILTGDIDGDGKPDLVVTSVSFISGKSGPEYIVSIYRNINTSGTLQESSYDSKKDFIVGKSPLGIFISDIDGDGKLDIIVTNSGDNTITVLHNTSNVGILSFDTGVTFNTGTAPIGIAISDLDGDGKADIVVANNSDNTISILHNLSTPGKVSFENKVDIPMGPTPYRLVIGDLDGDGKPDIVVTYFTTSTSTVSVLHNKISCGDIITASSFVKTDYSTGNPSMEIALSDIDGDGKMDIVTTYSDYSSNSLMVLRNTSNSATLSFAAVQYFPVGGSASSELSIGDLNGDGKPDIAINSGIFTISIFCNNSVKGTILLTPFPNIKIPKSFYDYSYGISIGDLNGDGKADIVGCWGNSSGLGGSSIGIIQNLADPCPMNALFYPIPL